MRGIFWSYPTMIIQRIFSRAETAQQAEKVLGERAVSALLKIL
jgi:hypothetical protein